MPEFSVIWVTDQVEYFGLLVCWLDVLFLAIGFLHWYEADNSEELRKAPLILIPVTLERSSAKEKFKLKYTLEEIGGNISLKAKLKNEFYIEGVIWATRLK